MRIAFFHGILGDATKLAGLKRLAGRCDRWVCLGDLFSVRKGIDPTLLALLGDGASLTLLAGEQERRLLRHPELPERFRALFGGLQQAGVEGGVALIGGGMRVRKTRQQEPKLVAPLTVAAHRAPSRIWREAGALRSVDEAQRGVWWLGGGAKIRLDLAPGTSLAILDTESGRLELHSAETDVEPNVETPARLGKRFGKRSPHRARRRVAAGQIALAI